LPKDAWLRRKRSRSWCAVAPEAIGSRSGWAPSRPAWRLRCRSRRTRFRPRGRMQRSCRHRTRWPRRLERARSHRPVSSSGTVRAALAHHPESGVNEMPSDAPRPTPHHRAGTGQAAKSSPDSPKSSGPRWVLGRPCFFSPRTSSSTVMAPPRPLQRARPAYCPWLRPVPSPPIRCGQLPCLTTPSRLPAARNSRAMQVIPRQGPRHRPPRLAALRRHARSKSRLRRLPRHPRPSLRPRRPRPNPPPPLLLWPSRKKIPSGSERGARVVDDLGSVLSYSARPHSPRWSPFECPTSQCTGRWCSRVA
jgi:hypothetical protein